MGEIDTMSAYTYICILGHVDPAPSLGTYDSCQCHTRVVSRHGHIGSAPCGNAIVRVPHDPVLEAAFLTGGTEAVRAILVDRVVA